MSARETILNKIRASQKAPADDSVRAATVKARLANTPSGIIPMRGQLPKDERIALFQAMAEKYNATVTHIDTIADLPGEVATYLKSKNLPAIVRMGDDPALTSAPWNALPALEVKKGATDGHDLAAVSHAFGAIAESGTLALASGPDNPVTLNFLPEHHIVAVDADRVLGDMEAVFALHRSLAGKGVMPRTLNLVTGPSRSADIEQTILLGAHGPRALHIVIVGV